MQIPKPIATVEAVLAEMDKAAASGDPHIHKNSISARLAERFDLESIAPAMAKAVEEGKLIYSDLGFLSKPELGTKY